ncbi:MAG: hypothetical protein ACOCQ4_00660 [bacterium]
MDNISGNAHTWIKEQETKKTKTPTTKKKKQTPCSYESEILQLKKIQKDIAKKYDEHKTKQLNDSLTYIDDIIRSLSNLN